MSPPSRCPLPGWEPRRQNGIVLARAAALTHRRPRKDDSTMDTPGVVGSNAMSAPASSGPAAPTRHARNPLVSFALSPISPSSWKAFVAILLGFGFSITAFVVVTSLLSAGASLLIVIVGIPIIALAVEAARLYARVEVWRMTLVDDRPLIQRPHRPLDPLEGKPFEARVRGWFEAIFLDAARWFDMAYVAVSFPLAVIEFTVAITLWTVAVSFVVAPLFVGLARLAGAHWAVSTGGLNPSIVLPTLFVIGLVLLPVAASATRGMAILHRYVVEGLLCISPAEALQRENSRLRESRSAAVELEASELRRIERDLHDGAQQRQRGRHDEREGDRPERDRHRELDDGEREGHRDVRHVVPAGGVEEDRLEPAAHAGLDRLAVERVERAVGALDERAVVHERHPPDLHPGVEPGGLDRERDDGDAHQDDQKAGAG